MGFVNLCFVILQSGDSSGFGEASSDFGSVRGRPRDLGFRLGDLRVISGFVDGGVISRPSILSSQWEGRRAVADEPRSAEVSLGGGRAEAHPPFLEEKSGQSSIWYCSMRCAQWKAALSHLKFQKSAFHSAKVVGPGRLYTRRMSTSRLPLSSHSLLHRSVSRVTRLSRSNCERRRFPRTILCI